MKGPYLTSSEAAEVLRTTKGVLANWRCRGEGPRFIKLRRKILYDSQDLAEWVEIHKIWTIDQRKAE